MQQWDRRTVGAHDPACHSAAHDCITLFLGSKEKYLEYFRLHPGVYFKTTGWLERGEGLTQHGVESIRDAEQDTPLFTDSPMETVPEQAGMLQTYEQLVAKYGEDNARFLYDELCNMTRNYSGMAFIEMGVEPDDRFERQARRQAGERGWKFEKLRGDMTLLMRLVDGPWDADQFLIVPPGACVAPSYDESVIKAAPLSDRSSAD